MPPRFAFGYWWSRYWNYSDSELRELVGNFERYRIPLDVLVIDMDWHRTDGLSWDPKYAKKDAFGQSVGWTGYSWNKSLFPAPARLPAMAARAEHQGHAQPAPGLGHAAGREPVSGFCQGDGRA